MPFIQHFDAVIVATGRYNAPNVPNISGIKEWNDRFPGRIVHSRQYRRPESLANQTVLIIGAAVRVNSTYSTNTLIHMPAH